MFNVRFLAGFGVVKTGMLAGLIAMASTVSAQVIKERRLAPDLFLLQGGGANSVVYASKTDAVLINTKAAESAAALTAKLGELTKLPLRYVVLTQATADCIGSVGGLSASTEIVSHDFVRETMLRVATSKTQRLPDITFARATSFHFATETMRVTYRGPAVSDGDLSVWFRNANVIYAGPLFAPGRFPRLNPANGADLSGLMTAVTEMLGRCNDKTQLVPAYGEPVGKAELARYQLMLQATRKLVQNAARAGRSAEQMEADGLLSEWADWGKGDVSVRQWIESLAPTSAK